MVDILGNTLNVWDIGSRPKSSPLAVENESRNKNRRNIMNKNRVKLIRECDRLCHLLCAHSFLHRCILCGQPATDPHHWLKIRSILTYRWTLQNLVYMCRQCHAGAESDHVPLYRKIKADYPHLWAWGENQPPLKNRPISTWQIGDILASLQHTADQLEIKRSTSLP